MRSACIIGSAVIAALIPSSHAQTGQAACERLRTLHSGSSRILNAEYSVAGEFRAPAAGSFNPPPMVLLAHCSVRAFTPTGSDSQVTSEIWLPDATAWSGKLLATGDGGYSERALVSPDGRGTATRICRRGLRHDSAGSCRPAARAT